MYLFQRYKPKSNKYPCYNLHSTMYLFQPVARKILTSVVNIFTFHYVSISTEYFQHVRRWIKIYIPLCIYFNVAALILRSPSFSFTFHYVSISTEKVILHISMYRLFTFHYVSISTRTGYTRKCAALIYIPLCIYFNKDAPTVTTAE